MSDSEPTQDRLIQAGVIRSLINTDRRRYAARSYAKRSAPYSFEHRAIVLIERVSTVSIEMIETAAAMQNLGARHAMGARQSVVGVRGSVLNGVRNGAPEEIRTPDPQIRSLVLYPAELRARFSRGVLG